MGQLKFATSLRSWGLWRRGCAGLSLAGWVSVGEVALMGGIGRRGFSASDVLFAFASPKLCWISSFR